MRKFYLLAACAALAAGASAMPVRAPRLTPSRASEDSPTALSSVRFVLGGAPAPLKAPQGWNPVGTGTLRDDFVTSYYLLDPMEWEVEICESATTPGLYLLMNPYDDFPLLSTYGWDISQGPSESSNYIKLHAEDPARVWIEASPTGLHMPGGYLIVNSYVGLHYDNNGQSWDFTDPTERKNVEGAFGTMDDNYGITFAYSTLLCQLAEQPYQTTYQWDYANLSGAFRVRLPQAKRYDIKMSTQISGTQVTATVNAERDVERLLVAITPGDDERALLESILAGDEDCQTIRGPQGTATFDIPENGIYTIVAVGYGQGEAQTYNAVTREYTPYAGQWRTCEQKALYTDGVVSAIATSDSDQGGNFLGVSSWTGNVPVEVSNEQAGLVRLVNPFSADAGCPLASNSSYDSSRNHYMTFDITDPDYVMMLPMDDTGLFFNFGTLMVESRTLWYIDIYGEEQGWYDHSDKAKQYAGQLRDGAITFPVNALHVKFPAVQPSAFGGYYGNSNGTFRVQLPDEAWSSVEQTLAEQTRGEAVYYDLTGRRVAHPGSGIYVKVQGGRATKVRL